jgi:microcin C transport system substrate-binding protein
MRLQLLVLVLLLISGCTDPAEQLMESTGSRPLAGVQQYYRDNPDFFVFRDIADLPQDLHWQDGQHLPDIGSPEAVKGGTSYTFMSDFPRTLRWLGPDSNSHFRRYIYGETMIGFGGRHPSEFEIYPGLARQWAIDRAAKTVYIRLDPAARWSDGHPVTSDDFLFLFYVALSPHIQSPWYNNVYRVLYASITRYDEHTLAITTNENRPDMDAWVLQLAPMPEHFLGELDESFVEKFNWRFWPTTGPYVIHESDIRKGRSITLTRLQDWWGRDRKFFRYRFNPDRVRISVVRDRPKAVEMFRRGDLDLLHIDTSQDWYERFPDDDPDIAGGYIHKNQFYFQHPLKLRGIYMNMTRKPFDNPDVRLGIQYACNWQLVIDKIYRGDYRRLNTANDGFGEFSHPDLKARQFDPVRARGHFASAGYTEVGPDGVLTTKVGERLSFTLTYGDDQDSDMLTVLKQEALKAGLEFRLENLDLTAAWKKVQEKKHELQYTGFSNFLEMYPRYWEGQHSDGAYDRAFLEDGSVNPARKPKPQTNNYEGYADSEVDALIEQYDASSDPEEMIRIAHRLEEMFHDNAALVPGAVADFYRVLHWRWVRFPDGFNEKHSQSADQRWVHWIDVEAKTETQSARKRGSRFEPQINIFDQYRLSD